jgi:outer membrane lipoprotein-sorting protein
MRRLRTASLRRLALVVGIVAALGAGGALAQAALGGADSKPPAKPLDQAIVDAANAPEPAGVSARITFTNGLLPAGTMPRDSASPLASGATGRLWVRGDGTARLELQSDAGDAQIVADGKSVSVYEPASKTVYTMATPSDAAAKDPADAKDAGGPVTLAKVREAIAKLSEAWTLSGAQPDSVAGRPAYTVRIAPKDDGGLLGAAEVAWDAATGAPLRAAVYATGADKPVLELVADEISFDAVPAGDVAAHFPADAKVVTVKPPAGHETGKAGDSPEASGPRAVQAQLPFTLSAPDTLASLPRKEVRLVDTGDQPGAVVVYGRGLGAIVVFQHKADTSGGQDKQAFDASQLPRVNIDGATGSELATPLGTVVTFTRGGVTYVVAGSVPPVAAENAARGL